MSASNSKTAVPVVLGAMTFGSDPDQSRIQDLSQVNDLLSLFASHGHTEIDTSRVYGHGTSEEYLGKLDLAALGLRVSTKLYPTKSAGMGDKLWTHSPEDLQKGLGQSLGALKTDKVDIYYLHGPDRTRPWEETLGAIDDLYKQGKFERFGISNFMSWEVAEICAICDKHGWIRPTVYQGLYNAIHRAVEPELFPCLRKHGIGFYSFNPLAGGFFAGKMAKNSAVEPGSRFDPEKPQGKAYRARYWSDAYFEAVDAVKSVAEAHGLTLAETALRWMMHHSKMEKAQGDAVLIGASSRKHLEDNLVDFEKSPLPDDVVQALDKAWEGVRGNAWKYWH